MEQRPPVVFAAPADPGAGMAVPLPPGRLGFEQVVAALVAGAGSAAVWTFGRDVITSAGGLPERTTAALWVLLGAAAVLGASASNAVVPIGALAAPTGHPDGRARDLEILQRGPAGSGETTT